VPFDRRAQWSVPATGDEAGGGLEVTAAALGRRPVYFEVRGAFSEPGSPWVTWPQAPRSPLLGFAFTAVSVILWVAGGLFARRNLRLGRGDRRGAFRIAASFFVAEFAALLLSIHWVPDARAVFFSLVRMPGAAILMQALLVWLLYLAVEPYFRARWPRPFVSWNRLLAGKLRDPLVGRDVLGGVLGGVVLAAALQVASAFPWSAALVARRSSGGDLALLLGTGPFLAHVLESVGYGFILILPGLLLLLAAHALVRRLPLALGIAIPLCGVAFSWLFGFPLPVALLLSAGVYLFVIRLGVLPLCVATSTSILLLSLPMALSGPAWLVRPTLLGMAVPLAIALWGLRTTVGARTLVADPDL
jgi:hypothetical protein